MKELKLTRLFFENFRGAPETDLVFSGKDAVLAGDNAAGKTRTKDAFSWLLFGKNSQGRSDFAIKPLDSAGNVIHESDVDVLAELSLNGDIIVLQRIYKEKWTRKRGAASADLTGHTTKYLIDQEEVKEKDYKAFIQDKLMDHETFSLLTDTGAFNRLKWEKRREKVLQVCGDISEADVLKKAFPADNKEGFKFIDSLLKNDKDLDSQKDKLKSSQRMINNELKEIPARIDELHKSVSEIEQPDLRDLERLNGQLKEQRDKFNSLDKGTARAEKEKEIIEIGAEIQRKITAVSMDSDKAFVETQREINAKVNEIDRLNHGKQMRIENKKETRDKIAAYNNDLDRLRSAWKAENKSKPAIEDICPTCGQDLPEDQIDAALKKWQNQKAENIAGIDAEAKATLKAIKSYTETAKEVQEEIDTIYSDIEKTQKEHDALVKKADALKNCADAPGTAELEKRKDALQMEIDGIDNGFNIQKNGLEDEIENIEQQIAEHNKAQAAWDATGNTEKRIKELEARKKELAGQYDQAELEFSYIDTFVMTRINLLEDFVADKFKITRFKMFKEQVNGGITQCCEAMLDGVPYESGPLNTGGRRNVDLDIINTLSEYHGFKAPIFIDDAESVTKLLPVDTQAISLYVKKGQKKLKLTKEKE